MSSIKKISTKDLIEVRNTVLRPNQPIESCYFEGDNLPTTTHFGFYEDEKLIGIVSTYEKMNAVWDERRQIQIRGMAILEEYQRKGIGEQLIQAVINFANDTKTELLWFNARKNAVPFYEKLDFQVYGTAFEIEGVGTHYLMYRSLFLL